MDIIQRKPAGKKEKAIVKEIESYGFHVIWIKGTFSRYREFRDGFMDQYIKGTSLKLGMTTQVNMDNGEIWNAVILSQEAMRIAKKSDHRNLIVDNLIHELAHVIQIKEKDISLNDPDIFDKAHGLRFCEIYTDLIDKYDIRYAERDFYLGVLE